MGDLELRKVPPLTAAAAAALVLVVLDLARPYAGRGLVPVQVVAAALGLLALARCLAARGQTLREAWPVLALAAAFVPTYLEHTRHLAADGIHYYAYLRSLLFDLDLDLVDDYQLLGWADPHTTNVLPVGAPFLWSVLLVPLHLLREAARLFGASPPNGAEPLYQGAVCLATVVYGAVGAQLLQLTLRRWVSPGIAFWTTLACWLGSPVRFYVSVLPGHAHGTEFFAAVLVLRTYLAFRDRPERGTAIAAGAACGLVFLTRSQDGLLLGLVGLEVLRQLVVRPAERRRVFMLGVVVVLAFVVAALPQFAVWQAMFGVPFLIPHKVLHGSQFMHAAEPQLAGTLLSPRGGLFVNYPLMLVAFVGLLVLARRDLRYVATALPVLLAGWYLNSTIFDWYQVRRFTGVVPLLAPGLAVVLAPLAGAGWLVLAMLVFLALRYDLAVDTLRALPGDAVSPRAAMTEASDSFAADVYRFSVRVSPRAAAALVGAYTGERFLSEDAPSRIDMGTDDPVLTLPERAHNLSGIEGEAGERCRWVTDRDARVYVPLAWHGEVIVTVRARPLETEGGPQVMHVSWNESPVGDATMGAEWAEYRFHAPAAQVRAGLNVITLAFDRAPIYRRVRGVGPREPRPAALAWIELRRGDGS